MKSRKPLPLSKVYGLLEPGPVLLLTTAHKGRRNIMTLSWHMMVDFEPPLVACIVSNLNHSFSLLKASKTCVLNIPTVDIAEKVVRCGNVTGARTDKFQRFGLTPLPASTVEAPLIAECHASLECRVADTRLVSRYGLFVLQVLRAWIDPAVKDPRTLHHRGHGCFMVAGNTIRLKSRMK
ncbi:flavin reductase family protein [Prosthecobacter sp.]|uniref:flavin reductase family protein n=1 Tax=Prosthecobacter sp. TaxID=1965333 RepID=UPI0037834718